MGRTAMSEEHDADETTEQGGIPRSVNRRKFVKALGVTGVATTGLSSVATAQTRSKAMAVDVTEPTGTSRRNMIESALSDKKTKKISHKFAEIGWKQNVKDARCVLSDPADAEPYHVVSIPFKPTNSGKNQNKPRDEQVNLVWLERVPTGAEIERVSGHRAIKLDPSKNGEHNTDWKIVTYSVESGNVVSRINFIGSEPQSDSETDGHDVTKYTHIKPPGAGGDGCPPYSCKRPYMECDHINMDCVTVIAAAYATTISTCASCPASGWSCLACIGSIAVMKNTKFTCDIGVGCITGRRCTPCCSPEPPGGCA